MQLVIMRHGETDFNVERRYTGQLDIPLDETGRREARAAGCCEAIATVYTSHLARARETARICFPNARQIVRPAFAEMNFGDFQGRTADEMADDPAYRSWVEGGCTAPCPHGESQDQQIARVCAAVQQAVAEQAEAGATRTIIVAHGGTVMSAFSTLACANEARNYFDWLPGNCCGFRAGVVPVEPTVEGPAGRRSIELANIQSFSSLDFLR